MPQDPVKFLETEAMLGLLDNLNISRVVHSSLMDEIRTINQLLSHINLDFQG